VTAVPTALLAAAITIAILMLATWVASLVLKNASIVDIVWGLGFVIVGWVVRLALDHPDRRSLLLVLMATAWGLRLAVHLFIRNHGKGEDYRYRAMRRHYGERFGIISLRTVFGLQGLMMFLVSLPIQLGQTRDTSIGVLAIIGIVVWAVGLAFEAIGDMQLTAFKRNPASAGQVMDRGLWRYTRHPNYFGDACVWWGIGLVAAECGIGAIGLIGPLVMTVLLVKVSGVPMLERSMAKRRPGYADYVRNTSSFVPRPPRKSPTAT